MNYRSLCLKCQNLNDDNVDGDVTTCQAFPNGIPDDILRKGFDHRLEYQGDNGVRFVPDAGVSVDWIEAWPSKAFTVSRPAPCVIA